MRGGLLKRKRNYCRWARSFNRRKARFYGAYSDAAVRAASRENRGVFAAIAGYAGRADALRCRDAARHLTACARANHLREFHHMAVHNLSGISSMLAQMRAVVSAAEGADGALASRAAGAPGGFATELRRSLQRVSTAQMHAHAQADAFELGAPDVSLNDVMIDMQKANLSFQTAVQVRNKLVSAYQEIASMQV